MKYILLCILLLKLLTVQAQIPDAVYSPRIQTVLLHPYGNQLGQPIITLGAIGGLELHFDDLDANVRNYSYTFQLCNADWTPAILSQFDFISGFSQQRINTYRVSSIAFTRYTHYQATLPDRNCAPSRSGNYILKVFLNGDTSKLIITKRMLVVKEQSAISAQIQQPFNGQIFRTHQKYNSK
ncbi:type IX secretion system plug protein domain-containing protein [Paraflavitalea speifideaquila]|uniref:type IX secretion system plug protein n=1 Tax=Paraflavitalea speifideaquila TaxID=3076558 RepID=UPI003313077B